MINYTLIENDEKLKEFRITLHDKKIDKIAMDFEGIFERKCCKDKLCLIQIYDCEKYYIIDPLKISKEELIIFFKNRKIIKYMYSAGSDVKLIYDYYKIKLQSVFDIKHLVEVLRIRPQGLYDIVKSKLNIIIKFDKKKFQRYDWSIRPLRQKAIDYALNDVKYLFKLNDILKNEVIENGLIDDFIIKLIKVDYDFSVRKKIK